MKNLIDNLNDFICIKEINENNIFVLSNFYLKHTGESYPINIKKFNDGYIIHDGGRLIMYFNENDIKLNKELIQSILNDDSSFMITQNNELVYVTSIDTINIDIAKYIQIITKIAD